MDNKPWIEKYRPNQLNKILSQDEIINTITKLIENNKLPHMLFHGPSGIGKTSTIISLSRKIYGDNYKQMILELNGSDDRGINVVREKIKQFSETKVLFNDTVKLIILDEADSMTIDAQSALRRIIEKYTYNVRFCLICNYVNKIIPALQSRCMSFRFKPISTDVIYKRLKEISKKENVDINKSAIDIIIRISKGDFRKAINLLQSVSMSNNNKVDDIHVYSTLGYPIPMHIINIYDILVKESIRDCFYLINNIKEENSLSLMDIIRELLEVVATKQIEQNKYVELLIHMANIEKRLSIGSNEDIQLSGLISIFNMLFH